MATGSLKKKNLKLLAFVVALDILIIWVVLLGGDSAMIFDSKQGIDGHVLKSFALSSLASILSLALCGAIPTRLKEALVFWRWTDALPGHRAFSQYAPTDPRVDMVALAADLGTLPTEPKAQNLAWYKLKRKHETDPGVQDAEQYYLLFRDLAAISITTLLLAILCWIIRTPPSQGYPAVILLLIIQYGVFVGPARNCSHRLIANVLALHSSKSSLSKKSTNTRRN